VNANTAGLSAAPIRYLKIKRIIPGFSLLFRRRLIAAHLVSPVLRDALYGSKLDFRATSLWLDLRYENIRDHCAYIRRLPDKRFAQINSNGSCGSTSDKRRVVRYARRGEVRNVRRLYQEPWMPKMRSNDVLADYRAGTSGF
jgi:hypothetical protein